MKPLLLLLLAAGVFTQQSFGQGAQADQIKRRAKDLNQQNNVRQGVAPPKQAPAKPVTVPAPTTARTAATAPPATVQQQHVARLKADLASLKVGTPMTAEQKKQLTNDLLAAARGPKKPSVAAVGKFVNNFATALGGKTLDPAQQSRLAQNLEAVVNSAAMPVTQTDAIAGDVQAILEVSGAKRNDAASVAKDVKALAAELR
ncbi:MAG: hypothetical protein KIS67_16800 [Verrucomicrobiae bacterium]|nr:hypothetical protein [Verrucomicrobiae bacterium]